MSAAEILGVDAVRFIEPEFSALTDFRHNAILAATRGDEGRLLLDEHEEPLALAFRGPDGWIAGSFLFRNPSVALIELFENVNGEIFQEDRAIWAGAVREYFSNALVTQVPPSIDDLNPKRHGILKDFIDSVWGKGKGETCIDCCCGSGVGSAVLRDLGFSPLSYDNDEYLLSRGLTEKRLIPEETMWIDATIASRYIEPVPKGVAIMAGEFNSFNQDMWERIAMELCKVTQETLITVGTEKEAMIVQEWGTAMDRSVTVNENPADPLYDRWVCHLMTR
ncbi:MAG: hypothetical protein M0Q91_13165 [Methanoregula sp.]|jgi:hypothetical protein|nr:hypothetical protein [Methanoregula sp.]